MNRSQRVRVVEGGGVGCGGVGGGVEAKGVGEEDGRGLEMRSGGGGGECGRWEVEVVGG